MERMDDVFKVKIEYEGLTLTKSKAKGVKGLEKIFKAIKGKMN